MSFAQISCVDLSPYTVSYLNDVSFDYVTYPVGTAFVTTGYIQYVKPTTGNSYQGVQGDSLFYIGNLDIDVSTDPCPNHTLTFSCTYLEGLAVDGDIIYNQLNPPGFYTQMLNPPKGLHISIHKGCTKH